MYSRHVWFQNAAGIEGDAKMEVCALIGFDEDGDKRLDSREVGPFSWAAAERRMDSDSSCEHAVTKYR